jgi:two-component system phosphate regulon sensor histidine kinase PhoR
VRLCVADSGPGVPPEERVRIFERFYRLDSARSSTTGGTGLGLAIVKALVEAHGGTIRVESGPAGGALFSFTLPIASESTLPSPFPLWEEGDEARPTVISSGKAI